MKERKFGKLGVAREGIPGIVFSQEEIWMREQIYWIQLLSSSKVNFTDWSYWSEVERRKR